MLGTYCLATLPVKKKTHCFVFLISGPTRATRQQGNQGWQDASCNELWRSETLLGEVVKDYDQRTLQGRAARIRALIVTPFAVERLHYRSRYIGARSKEDVGTQAG